MRCRRPLGTIYKGCKRPLARGAAFWTLCMCHQRVARYQTRASPRRRVNLAGVLAFQGTQAESQRGGWGLVRAPRLAQSLSLAHGGGGRAGVAMCNLCPRIPAVSGSPHQRLCGSVRIPASVITGCPCYLPCSYFMPYLQEKFYFLLFCFSFELFRTIFYLYFTSSVCFNFRSNTCSRRQI